VSEAPSANTAGSHAVVAVLLYAVARILLVVVVGGVIYAAGRLLGVAELPVVVVALFALIIAMPLGIWVFSPLRRRATAALEVTGERRRAERDQLRARLRGEAAPSAQPDEAPNAEPPDEEPPQGETPRTPSSQS
jgi:Protein of unknown function (DUF4229)